MGLWQQQKLGKYKVQAKAITAGDEAGQEKEDGESNDRNSKTVRQDRSRE